MSDPQITIDLGDRSYPIHIGAGMLGHLPELLTRAGFTGRLMLVTNPVIAELYGNRLLGMLRTAGFDPELILVPEGEAYKSLVTAGHLYEGLSKKHAERGTPIIALGGGVIGDLAGFVASTYQRGVPFIQVPTTLLAQVDSSIGGKVAVNVGRLKNMAGAFYQPKMVVTDISTLTTLPLEELHNGLAEVIKSAIIADPELFAFLETDVSRILNREPEALSFIVEHSAVVKARIVEQDERDEGVRNLLNLGHTFGHAIETITKFEMKHGAAVAVGIAAAARLSRRLGLLPVEDYDRVTKVIADAGLPITFNVNRPGAFVEAMGHDKKKIAGKLKFILPAGIGSVILRDDIDPNLAVEALT
ncbi:3-dehydroquinate synthase [Dehalogenimonas etheniformans]|uniref:3-dehydroquinate synthase n=1 Tax=Dehalogenimonas etheniformans TaxID=1536648 RepID=A0A2P5P7I2_9CHLR|nr:3-dehydroquinate synthase [Dehalogenimonas etheniformans]PPD58244.1 3-dehydroquinate synthase [Dehalogenimonas etheniformans]QNT75653.1 3-dehydroquinate synthase [Dehalogenimonas etheniformans]